MAKLYEVAVRLAGQVSGGFLRSFHQASSSVRQLGTDMDRLREKEEKLFKRRQQMQKLQSRLTGNAAYATGAGAVAGAGLAASVSSGMSFEQQMSKVGAVSRASQEDMAKLEAQARQLGATTAWSATQAAEGMQYLAMAGFKTTQIVGAMPGMLSLASAAGVDLGRAADISSNILTGFGLKAEEMGRAGDVLVNTFTTSNTDLEMLGQTMKYAAPVAVAFGSSLEETAAMAGKLGDAGIQADQAGTSLRTMFIRMAKPPKQAAEALAALGVSTKDASGKMKPMSQILQELAQKESKLSEAGRLRANAMIFGTEALSAATVLMKQASTIEENGRSVLDNYTESLKRQGTAQETSDRMLDNLSGKVTMFKSALEGLQLVIYDQVAPALKEFADKATGAVTAVTEWAKAHPELTKAIAVGASAIAGLATAALPVVAAFKTVSFAISAVKLALIAVSGPVGIVVTAIAGLTAGFMYLWENCEGFRKFWTSMWEGISSAFKGIINGIIGGINKVIEGINAMGSFEVPDWVPGVGGNKFGFNIQPVPLLAAGGIATGPTPAIIGEGREPEAVLPLSRLSSLLGGGAGTSGGISVSFSPTINVGGASGSDVYAQVRNGLSAGAEDLRRQLENLMTQQRRLSYA